MFWTLFETQGVPPEPRISHTTTLVGASLVVVGGAAGGTPLSDVHILDTETSTWRTPNINGPSPPGIVCHATTFIESKGALLVYGGGDGVRVSNDLWMLDLGKWTWTKVTPRGDPPVPRVGQSSTLVGNRLYVFGGFARGHYLNDLYVLDLGTLRWLPCDTCGEIPLGRIGHTCSLYAGHLYLFGGSSSGREFHDVHTLDLRSLTWSRRRFSGWAGSRHSHTSTVADDKMILFGGVFNNQALDDVHFLNFETMNFHQPWVSGPKPAPRGRHTATLVDDKIFFVGGGAQRRCFDDVHVLHLGEEPETPGLVGKTVGSLSSLVGSMASYLPFARRILEERNLDSPRSVDSFHSALETFPQSGTPPSVDSRSSTPPRPIPSVAPPSKDDELAASPSDEAPPSPTDVSLLAALPPADEGENAPDPDDSPRNSPQTEYWEGEDRVAPLPNGAYGIRIPDFRRSQSPLPSRFDRPGKRTW